MSHVLWLSAHISATSFILLQISSLCCPSLLYSSTNTSGLTLFCTWLTARCLKYFPVCSRINCSSGNDDSSKKQKKKERTEEKNRNRTWWGKEKSYRPKHVLFLMFFLLIFIFLCLGQSSKNDENINKILRPFATCMMISSICFSLFGYFSWFMNKPWLKCSIKKLLELVGEGRKQEWLIFPLCRWKHEILHWKRF